MTMGERIKQLRKESGLTQTALAVKLGVTKGTVSTWETDSRMPGFETLDRLCELFDRRMDYILGRSDDASPFAMSEADKDELGPSEVEDDLTEYALKYARLDEYGRRAVEAIIRAEYERCRSMETLGSAGAYTAAIRIRRVPVAE